MINQKSYKYRLMYFTLNCGRLMLEEGGETYRVEDTMQRICRSRGLDKVHCYVTPTVVQLTSNADDNYSFSYRVTNRGTNLEKISMINQLARDFTSKKIDIDESEKRLEEIRCLSVYAYKLKLLWAGIIGGSFAILFMGGYKDFISAFIVTIVSQIVFNSVSRVSQTSYLANITSSFVIGVMAVFFSEFLIHSAPEKVISGAVMPIVPGVALTNGVRDLISSDLVSGVSRLMDALIIAMLIAFGVGGGMLTYMFFVR